MASNLRENDVVRLHKRTTRPSVPEGRDDNHTARVVCYMGDYYEGGVQLDRDLHGMKYWNEKDLTIVRRAK